MKNRLWGPSLLKGNGRLAWKMNLTFLMGNEVLNIFSFNNFFEKSNIFGETGEKFLMRHEDFLGVIIR